MDELMTESFNSVLDKFSSTFIPLAEKHPVIGALVLVPSIILVLTLFILIVIYYWLTRPKYMKERRKRIKTSIGELELTPREMFEGQLRGKNNNLFRN